MARQRSRFRILAFFAARKENARLWHGRRSTVVSSVVQGFGGGNRVTLQRRVQETRTATPRVQNTNFRDLKCRLLLDIEPSSIRSRDRRRSLVRRNFRSLRQEAQMSRGSGDLTRTRCRRDQRCPGSVKITTHLNHISHCKESPGTNQSNRWIKPVS